MRINNCFYCSAPVYPGHGILLVRNDSKKFIFCSSKCKSHYKVKHNPRKSRWTKAHRKTAGKELLNDPIFAFEKIRNTPVRYNRTLYQQNIKSIRIIKLIKEKRVERFFLQRMRAAEERHTPAMLKQLSKKDKLKQINSLIKNKASISNVINETEPKEKIVLKTTQSH